MSIANEIVVMGSLPDPNEPEWAESFRESGLVERVEAQRDIGSAESTLERIEGLIVDGRLESPIEAAFFLAFMHSQHNWTGVDVFAPGSTPSSMARALGIFDLWCKDCSCVMVFGPRLKALIIPQFSIGRYRADFLVIGRDWYGQEDMQGSIVTAVVECDGHEFHDRTKAQVARDKARDREITAAGLPVFRFAGSELWADPCACADQIWSFISRNSVQPEYADG